MSVAPLLFVCVRQAGDLLICTMATRYFHCHNANRLIGGEFSFVPYGVVGGSLMGIYATDKAGEQTKLDELLLEPRNAFEEITEAEYLVIQKKNPTSGLTTPRRSPIPVASSPVPPAAVNSAPVVLEGPTVPISLAAPPTPPTPEPVMPLPSAADAIKTGDVEPSQKPTPQKRGKARASEAMPAS